MAMSRLQLKVDGGARSLPLLVFQGAESEVDPGAAASLVWPDLLQATPNLSTSVPVIVPFRPVSALHAHGTRPAVLLREAYLSEAMRRH